MYAAAAYIYDTYTVTAMSALLLCCVTHALVTSLDPCSAAKGYACNVNRTQTVRIKRERETEANPTDKTRTEGRQVCTYTSLRDHLSACTRYEPSAACYILQDLKVKAFRPLGNALIYTIGDQTSCKT